MNNGIEICEYNGEGFSKVICYQSWRVAIINYAERFDRENMNRLERHLLTDEVFVLLSGEATLVGEQEELTMEPGKLYNVKAGIWHNIYVSRDAKVLIVENVETGPDNSEYKEIVR